MKVQYQLLGSFHRLQLSGTDSIPLSLIDIIGEVQAIATEKYRRTPQLLRQAFGLSFIPEAVLINLLQQVKGVDQENELYQIPTLKLLHHLKSQRQTQTAKTYTYQFIAPELTLTLTPDDPQLPLWTNNDSEKPGHYTVIIDKSKLSENFAHKIWQDSVNYWQSLSDIDKIHFALQSGDLKNLRITIPGNSNLTFQILPEDLSINLISVIEYLRLDNPDISVLSPPVKLLVAEYQSKYNIQQINFPEQLQPNETIPTNTDFLIGRGNSRSQLRDIIIKAQQFLLISSYIIEDAGLTELICEKSSQLPSGVWILTDLRDEVIDRIDAQIIDHISSPQYYQRSDTKKITCLKKLLNANISIRSGAFHLKTCISEKSAYLGSCNLTGGSLDFNLEAGIVSYNTKIHRQLINLFSQFWRNRSRDQVISDHANAFHLRSINHRQNLEYQTNLLTPSQYKRDLITQLSKLSGKVKIYSRSFHPSPDIEAYLRLLDTQIFIDSQMSANYRDFNIQKIANLHAKVTFLGDKLAYIGGINFNFQPQALYWNDLMYKTSNSQEINQIRTLLKL